MFETQEEATEYIDQQKQKYWYKGANLLDYSEVFGKSVMFGEKDKEYYVWRTMHSVFDPIPDQTFPVYKSADMTDAYDYFSELLGDKGNKVQYNSPKTNSAFVNKSSSDVNYEQENLQDGVKKDYSLFKSMQDKFLSHATRADYVNFDYDALCVGNIDTPNYQEWRVWTTKSTPAEEDESKVEYIATKLGPKDAMHLFKSIVAQKKQNLYRRVLDQKIKYLEKSK